ncbi:hypothetical protein CPLU01_03371 [Colletotrichum plurivorum]|uniref:Uncharacterized protein n=1 Tax=Colletotrichum plurivorum TaxID=2175906 RepID=A0A8H6KSQ8_9PEZI|nr:hypothetical protein CPLU01_03371 [Colletotrichum plurivorum]
MAMQPASLPVMGCGAANANLQLSHGTLVHDGISLDGQEYQRGDPVAVVDNASNEDSADSIHVLNLRNSQCILVLLKAVCWVPTHSEQRSGATFLLTLYGQTLDFRHPGDAHPRPGNRGIATLLGSSIYVAREVILEGNPSRTTLDAADRVSMFTVQWDALSIDAMQQPALTPSASSCASSRSPSEAGDDVPVMRFYRHQGRRDSAIEIRDPESPVYKSSMGRKASPKPLFNRSAFYATKQNIPISTELPANRSFGANSATWSDLGSDDEPSFDADASFGFGAGFPDTLDLCPGDFQMGMNADNHLQVNFVYVPQAEGDNYVPGHVEQQRADGNTQNTMWATPENAWNTTQVPEMRQPQMPAPQRQQQPVPRQEVQPEYYEHYRLLEHQNRPQSHAEHLEAPNMHNPQRGEYVPAQQLPQAATSHPAQNFPMQPRYPEHANRLQPANTNAAPFSMPQEVHVIQSNRHEPRPSYPLPSSSYSPVHEGSLPSTSHSQQPRRSPLPDDSRTSSARGTPVMARRAKPLPAYTFTPTAMVNSFRQSTQAQIGMLERHFEQLQHGQADDERLQNAQQTLQTVRRSAENSLQTLGLLQPISGIPFQGTERRLQSLADQIVTSMQNLSPEAEQSTTFEERVQKLNQKVQSLKEFIEYLEGVHPEAVKRAQGSAEPNSATGDNSRQEGKTASAPMAGRVPSAPASVSSQVALGDDSDSCRWVDGQATPPPDRSAAMAQNRDQSRLFRDVANGHGRVRPDNRMAAAEFYPVASYSRPSSHANSPITSHPAPAEPSNHAEQGFFHQPLPTPVQQAMPMAEYAIQSRPIQAYTPPASAELMRPMQAISGLPAQHYTTQQETPFCLRPPQQNCMYPAGAADMSQAGYAPRSPVSFPPAAGPAPTPGYYHDVRPGLPDRRTVRQERPAPYSLNYREQKRRRGSQ